MNIYSNKILNMEEQHKKDLIICLEIIDELFEKLKLEKLTSTMFYKFLKLDIKKKTENRMDYIKFHTYINLIEYNYLSLSLGNGFIYLCIASIYNLDKNYIQFIKDNVNKINIKKICCVYDDKLREELIQFLKDGKRQINNDILNNNKINDLEIRKLIDSLGFSCVY